MGYESSSVSHDYREEDDDDYEEVGGNHLLGFMFGNVDGSGDLDVDYLDEDAKEHLAALADKLGPSLTDIDLSVKSQETSDAAEQDYDEKAENAVDYEDIDEQYEGPEVQTVTEEDFLLPKKDYFSRQVPMATLENAASVFDDENYDEFDNEEEVVVNNTEVPASSSGLQQMYDLIELSQRENLPEDIPSEEEPLSDNVVGGTVDTQERSGTPEEQINGFVSTPLPILCIEDGEVILRFSEIFGINEPMKKAEKRGQRYSIPKDKYKCINISEIVEEDEEAFLRSSCRDFASMRQAHVTDRISAVADDKPKRVPGTGEMISEQDEEWKDSCRSAQPLKDDVSLNLCADWESPSCPKFCPLDQQDWEDMIIWNDSPGSSDRTAESREISGPDSDALADRTTDLDAESQPCSELIGRPCEGDEEARYHPQLLRLESRLGINDPNIGDLARTDASEDTSQSNFLKHFSKLILQNAELQDGSWVNNIIWDSDQQIAKPKLILDLQDEQMLFEVLDIKDSDDLRLHAGAMITTRSVKADSGDSVEPHNYGGSIGARFNISNDKFYTTRKSSQQLKLHSKKRTAHGLKILHSVPALKLQTMKAKLSNKDIANFHRPKSLWYPHDNEVALKEQGKLLVQGPMKILIKSLGGKGSKLHVDAEETTTSIKAKASKKLDFRLSEPVKIFYSGKELDDHKSLTSQNVRPNSLLHLVRTKIHLLPRAQKLPGEHKSLRPPGAFKKKSDLSVKDGHVFLMEYCEERPLLLGNAGMGARLCTYYQKSSPGDQAGMLMRNENNGLGNVLVLDPADKSPFLGDIKPACRQSCLETNMYRAPLFQHKVPSTDYLLVRSAKGKLSIRRIDRIDVVGQQEPHMEVMSPGSKGVQTYIMNRLLVYVYREFRAVEKRGLLPSIFADELSAQFPSLSEAFLRKRLKHCADLQRGSNGLFCWVMRRNFRIPSEEELRRMVTPENVCSYESMQAGMYRLKRLGITRLTHPTGLSSAMNQLPDEAIALAAAAHIERELQITPWNLSSNFVACTSQNRENIERLEITGVGDPSGRGLGFSYVRSTPKVPISNAMTKKKAVVGKGSTVTGTDADLRRLSMEAAREVLLKFNVPDEQIAKQTRWHRIAMIRKLSSEQAASGVKVDPSTISKFARGQRMSFLQLQQQTREKCQEIWDRQVLSLSAVEDEDTESDFEANSDLDSFAGDLENLLDAEECEEGEEGSYDAKRHNADIVKGLKMRRRPLQAQVEDEIEDEAAEAAELCRLLMDDDDAVRKKKKKEKDVVEQVGQLRFDSDNAERIKKTKGVIKPFVKPDSLYVSTEDGKEDDSIAAKRISSGKVKAKKKNDIAEMDLLNKKIKILGDGIKISKEKKSAREVFVCGACGQLGHMRTNKNCPKYGEDPESVDQEKPTGKSNSQDHPEQPQRKTSHKKVSQKSKKQTSVAEAREEDKSVSKPKILKVKCGSTEKLPERPLPATSLSSELPVTSEAETGNKSAHKFGKLTISNKMKPEDQQAESHKSSIIIRPPVESTSQPPKKIIIKRSINVDDNNQETSTCHEYRKMKNIAEISSFENHEWERRDANRVEIDRIGEHRQWWGEEELLTNTERHRDDRGKRMYEQMRMLEEQEKLAALRNYEDVIRREREEEELLKAKMKLKKKKRSAPKDEYLDHLPRRNDRRLPERTVKRSQALEFGRTSSEYSVTKKRRRGGEVGLANVLENIVEQLKGATTVSFLFLKPVSKKEAPDYYDVIEHPMDLSTIKDKVRRMAYKNRDEFRHDVCQIVINAHKYNDTRNPHIPPLADQLLELCDHLLEMNAAELSDAECGIE